MKGVNGMVLIALLMVLLAIALIVIIAVTGIGGAVVVFVLGDVIVSIGIIAWLISKLCHRKKK